MRRTLLSTLAVAVLLGTSSVCLVEDANAAELELKPLVTVSFSGYDELRANIEFIGKLADNPKLAEGLEGLLNAMTQGRGLAGLDTTKPWGAVLQTDGQQFSAYAFIPVTELKQAMGVLGSLEITGGPPPEPQDGIYELETVGPTLYIQEKGGWAFIVNSREALAGMPDDPIQVLGGLNKKYDLAVRASIRNVPAMFRQMFTAQLQLGAQAGMQQMSGESDDDYAIRKGLTKRMIEQITTMADDLDEVLVGWAVDREAGTSYIDFEITAVEGTKTAAQFAQMAPAKTNFAGFNLPGAALTFNWAGALTDDDVTEAKSAIASVRAKALKELENQDLSNEQLQLASQLLGDLLDVLEKTVEGKEVDGGMVLLLDPGGLTFVAGSVLAEGAKLEKVVNRLVAELQKEEPGLAPMLKLDAETHQGVRFHTLALPIEMFDDSDDPVASKLFGEKLDVVVGLSGHSVYLAVGRDAAKTLKQVIDKSKAEAGKEIPPMRISVAATPIAKFVAEVTEGHEPTKQTATMIAGILEPSGGKDHITLTSKAIPNGASMRVEIEEGLLKLLGSLGQMMGHIGAPVGPGTPGGGPPPDDSPF